MDHGRCPFEKAILSTQCACELAGQFSVAEQIGVECRSELARNNCAMLLGLLRERARFVLKLTDTSELLPFGKELKVMLGGLMGLRQLMVEEERGAPWVANIHALVKQAQQTYGTLEHLPYQEIVKSIAAFQSKRRGKAPAQ